MKQRRIVPDNSVVIAAFFRDAIDVGGIVFDLSARSRPLVEAIRLGSVKAFAPDALFYEFMSVAVRKARPRNGIAQITLEELETFFGRFASLPIVPVAAAAIAPIAFDLTVRGEISPADSWYVACAIYADAELWISHAHSDGLVAKARQFHEQVYVLSERRF